MAGGPLSEFFIKLGVKVDKADLKKIDTLLKDIEKRLGGIGKAQVAEAKATDTATKATKRRTKAEIEQQKAAKEAAKVAAHQQKLRANWLKQQDAIALSAKRVHDFQMKLMRQAQALSNANTKQEVRNAQTVAKAVGSPRTALTARQIGANRRAWLNSTRGIEVRTGYNKQYRLGEQQAANAAKTAAERVAAEKEANRKIEQEHKRHLAELLRQEKAKEIRARVMRNIYGEPVPKYQASRSAQQQYQNSGNGSRSAASYSRANYLHAGGAAGAFMRYGAASLPFIGGVYGMGQLNQANQNLQSTEIANAAIFGERGDQAKNWLKQHANYVGYSYIDTAPIFSSFMASSIPLMGYDKSQELFASLTEFGRTRGADSVGMKRAMVAIQQMASKGQVTSEELKLQLSEARGFGESRAIFAEAWQLATGGKKTGAEAAAQLLEDMQNGKVKFDAIAPFISEIYKSKAAGGIDAARTSSIAEQARAGNAATEMLGAFSKSGGESGFARMWKGLTSQLTYSVPLAKQLGSAFDYGARQVEKLLTWTESFTRALEGKDSQVADWLGVKETEQFRKDWESIKTTISDVWNMPAPSWMPTLESTTREFAAILNAIAEYKKVFQSGSSVVDQRNRITSDIYATETAKDSSIFGNIKGAAKATAYWYTEGLTGDAKEQQAAYWKSKGTNFGTVGSANIALDEGAKYLSNPQDDALMSVLQREQSKGESLQQTTYHNAINMQITIENGTEGTRDWFENSFNELVNRTLVNFTDR